MDPTETAQESTDATTQDEAVSQNIARFIKEHEVTANRRNMHIHEDEEKDES
jgi:hypothetical protein